MNAYHMRILLFCFTLWLARGGVAVADVDQPHTLVLGVVSDNTRKAAATAKPMAQYVASKMVDVGITQGDFYIVAEMADMITALLAGKVDWLAESPFPILNIVEKSGAEFLVRRWKQGASEYHTIFISNKNDGVNSLMDLRGKKIIFQDKDSSSAFFVPSAIMKQLGLNMVELATPRENPPPDKVGYVFARDATVNQVAWLQRRMAQAAAMSNMDWQAIPAEIRETMNIFDRSQSYPRSVVVVRKGLDGTIKKRLQEVLLYAHEDPNAREALKAYAQTSKFDEITSAVQEGLDYCKEVLQSQQER